MDANGKNPPLYNNISLIVNNQGAFSAIREGGGEMGRRPRGGGGGGGGGGGEEKYPMIQCQYKLCDLFPLDLPWI